MESAQIMMERRAEIVWLNRDIRNPSMRTSPVSLFKKCLKAASINQANGTTRPIVVSLDMGAVGNSECLMTNSNSSPVGFTIDEVLEMIMIAGSDPNVSLFLTIILIVQFE